MRVLDRLLRRVERGPASGLKDASFEPFEASAEWVSAWSESAIAAQEEATFSRYSDSLQSWKSRAFLYHCIRATRPSVVVEIGTYAAGSARILAQALADNEHGHLYTADPYGAERCPPILERWPPSLRERVTFVPQNSMALAERLRDAGKQIDLAFIDGCHDFEFALFDALAMSGLMSRGGLMILDNSEQPGVIKACLEFMRLNPDFCELGSAVTCFDTSNPFDWSNRSDVPGTKFVLIAAPAFLSVAPEAFHATGQRITKATTVRSIRISNVRGPNKGTLFVEAWLRAFGAGTPVETRSTGQMHIQVDEASATVEIPMPLTFPTNLDETVHRLTYELGLFWLPDGARRSFKFGAIETL